MFSPQKAEQSQGQAPRARVPGPTPTEGTGSRPFCDSAQSSEQRVGRLAPGGGWAFQGCGVPGSGHGEEGVGCSPRTQQAGPTSRWTPASTLPAGSPAPAKPVPPLLQGRRGGHVRRSLLLRAGTGPAPPGPAAGKKGPPSRTDAREVSVQRHGHVPRPVTPGRCGGPVPGPRHRPQHRPQPPALLRPSQPFRFPGPLVRSWPRVVAASPLG